MKNFKKLAGCLLVIAVLLSETVVAFGETNTGGPSFGFVTGEVLEFLYDDAEISRLQFVIIQGEHGEVHLGWD